MKTLIVSIAAIAALPLFAQNATSTLSGTITDETGAAITGAVVTAASKDRSQERSALSSRDGLFTIPLLPPGRFEVHVKKPGFAAAEVKDVDIRVGETLSIQVTMHVGATRFS